MGRVRKSPLHSSGEVALSLRWYHGMHIGRVTKTLLLLITRVSDSLGGERVPSNNWQRNKKLAKMTKTEESSRHFGAHWLNSTTVRRAEERVHDCWGRIKK